MGGGYRIGKEGGPPLSYLDGVEGLLVTGCFGLAGRGKGVELRLAQGFLNGQEDVPPEGLPVDLGELECLVVLVEEAEGVLAGEGGESLLHLEVDPSCFYLALLIGVPRGALAEVFGAI